MRLAGVGQDGQRALAHSTVLIVGIGALGTHTADTLARAGIGRLLLCDRDIVDPSNLQRQVLFDERQARDGIPKAVAAKQTLTAINSSIAVVSFVADCNLEFLDNLEHRPDLILDGTDNFATRYLINDWCRKHGVPWIYAGAVGTEGAAMVIHPDGACLRCLWPQAPSNSDVGTCETTGVLAPAIAAVTAFQSAEAIKLLCGKGDERTQGVFTCDVWRGHYQVVQTSSKPAPDCPACAASSFPALQAPTTAVATLCGRDAVQITPPRRLDLDLAALHDRLQGAVENLERTAHLLRFVADGVKISVFPGGRALLFSVQDPLRAQALYDRWIGN